MSTSGKKYHGIYRGVVTENIDPENRGRLQVEVADVAQFAPSTWAEACIPLGGGIPPMGIYVVPLVGANVWVQFEQGDIQYPVWIGCSWTFQAEIPPLALAGIPGMPNIVLQTAGQNTILMTDLPGPEGGIILKSPLGAMIIVNDTGIIISNGKGASITLIGDTILMNEGALTIM